MGRRYCGVGMGLGWYSGCGDKGERGRGPRGVGFGPAALSEPATALCREAAADFSAGPRCALGAYLALCFAFSHAFSAGERSLRLSPLSAEGLQGA